MTTRSVDAGKVKIMLLLPLFALPFCALIFWALGGGQGKVSEQEAVTPGLNTLVPGPELKERSSYDKLSLYRQADRDSSLWEPDPVLEDITGPPPGDGAVSSTFNPERHGIGKGDSKGATVAADQLEQRLERLQKLLAENEDREVTSLPAAIPVTNDSIHSPELAKLESLVMQLGEEPAGQDLELKKMDGMLDKILQIQNPGSAKESPMASAELSKNAIAVVPEQSGPLVDWIGSNSIINPDSPGLVQPADDVFFELEEDATIAASQVRAIGAVVHGDQLLVSGATIKIRLTESISLQSRVIPAGSFLYGNCALSGERLQVQVASIQYDQQLFSVNLVAYDMDGLPGIRIPGSISRDAAKKSTDDAIQAISMATMDPSLGAQATAAGIETAKSLLSRKVKLVKVTVKADYPLLLKDMNNR